MLHRTLTDVVITSPDAQLVAMRFDLEKSTILKEIESSGRFSAGAFEFTLTSIDESSIRAFKNQWSQNFKVIEVREI